MRQCKTGSHRHDGICSISTAGSAEVAHPGSNKSINGPVNAGDPGNQETSLLSIIKPALGYTLHDWKARQTLHQSAFHISSSLPSHGHSEAQFSALLTRYGVHRALLTSSAPHTLHSSPPCNFYSCLTSLPAALCFFSPTTSSAYTAASS